MNPFFAPVFVLATSLGLAPGVIESPRPEPIPAPALATAELVLEPGAHEVTALIDKVASVLNRNYLVNEQEMGGKPVVRIQTQLALSHDEIEPTLGRLLYSVGFAIVPLDDDKGIAEIIAFNGPRRTEITSRARWLSPEEVLATASRVDFVTTAVSLQHVNANQAASQLRPFLSSGGGPIGLVVGSLSEYSVVLQGTRQSVASALRLIMAADEAAAHARERAGIEELVERVQRLEGGNPAFQGRATTGR